MLQIRRSAECLHLGVLRGPPAGGDRLRSRSESPRRPTEPAAIPALDRVSGEDVRVAPSKCYRGMVSDKDGPRARFLHVALTIKLSRQIYARLGELGKTMLTLHREWFS